jgi:hypothetical protein
MRKSGVWRMAVAGNAAALLLLTFIFVQGPRLFAARSSIPPALVTQPLCVTPGQGLEGRASRVLVIVVDALRLDRATDYRTMPTLTALARQGSSAVSVVETLIPSTVAAIQALIAGVIVPPLAFVDDFTASPAEHGGVLEAIRRCGGRTFVAGPRLWTDLYAAWISDAVTTNGFVEDDARLLAATTAALDRKGHQLVVVHFSRPDHAAHQYGAHSAEYTQALRWSDDAIAQLGEHVDATTAVVVTADHGVTRHGGHAGLEPAVRLTPLVTWGPGVSSRLTPSMPQAEIPLLLRATLQSPPASVSAPLVPSLPSLIRILLLLTLAFAVISAQRLLGSLYLETARPAPDALLNAAVWLTLLLSFYEAWHLALALSVAVVFVTARRVPWACEPHQLLALGVGCLFGSLRLTDGVVTSGDDSPGIWTVHSAPWSAAVLIGAPLLAVGSRVASRQFLRQPQQLLREGRRLLPWPWLLAVVFIAYSVGGTAVAVGAILTACVGLLLGRCLLVPPRYSPVTVGIIAACIPAAGARLVGETVSLSTIDVHVAFTLANSNLGLPGAIATAIVRQALPSLCVGISVGWALHYVEPAQQGRFAAGLAGSYMAQGFPAAAVMFAGHLFDPAVTSLALGSVLHILNEVTFSFLTLAGVLYVRSRSNTQPGHPAAASPMSAPQTKQPVLY